MPPCNAKLKQLKKQLNCLQQPRPHPNTAHSACCVSCSVCEMSSRRAEKELCGYFQSALPHMRSTYTSTQLTMLSLLVLVFSMTLFRLCVTLRICIAQAAALKALGVCVLRGCTRERLGELLQQMWWQTCTSAANCPNTRHHLLACYLLASAMGYVCLMVCIREGCLESPSVD